MKTWVLLFCFAGMVPNYSNGNAYFVYKNTFYASYNSWLVTFTYDIEPYRRYLGMVRTEVNHFRDSYRRADLTFQIEDLKPIKDHMNMTLNREVKLFELEMENLNGMLDNIESIIHSNHDGRTKRALIPFLGSILSAITGTPTESDMTEIRNSVSILGRSQEQVIHIVQESVSLINATHHDVRVNREALNNLSNATVILEKKFKAMTDGLDVIKDILGVYELAIKLHDLFDILTNVIRQAHFNIVELSNNFMSSNHGMLSQSLVGPVQLHRVLRQIQNQLPKDLGLPFRVDHEGLVKYYKFLQPLLIADSGKFHVVLSIPLLNLRAGYELFETIDIPAPNINLSLSARYELEASYIELQNTGQGMCC